MKDDAQLLADLEAELDWDPSVDSRGIIVSVKNAVVTLAGHVTSFMDKWHAERAVKRVAGVRAVANEIDIRLATEAQYPDKEIAQAAANALQATVGVPAADVKAIVNDGWITLEGIASSFYQREAAERAVRGLWGVKGVKNAMLLKPSITAHDLHNQIETAFERHALVDATQVNVSVSGNAVTLSGTVSSWHERDAAERVAWAAPGVTSVANHLTLCPRSAAHEPRGTT